MSFDIPILFIVFNRVDKTKKVFDIIKFIKPKRLFISADGPRDNKTERSASLLCQEKMSISPPPNFNDRKKGLRK